MSKRTELPEPGAFMGWGRNTRHLEPKVDTKDDLPSGWREMSIKPGLKPYYYNVLTRESCTEKPTVKQGFQNGDANGDGTTPTSILTTPGQTLPSSQIDRDNAQQGTSAQPAWCHKRVEDSGDTLPAGWEQFLSQSTGQTYYYNNATGESCFERPATAPAP